MGYILKLYPKRIATAVIQRTIDVLRVGGVILYPTETLYGFGCDMRNEAAIERIVKIKQRPNDKPFLVIAHNRKMVWNFVDDIPPKALQLIDAFWPGPLTVLLPAKKGMSKFLVGEDGKIGVRVPDNAFCLKLLGTYHAPIVSTSANISGQIERPSIEELKKQFGKSVDLVIDAGDLPSTLPSTVVDVSNQGWKILREGCISRHEIEAVLPGKLRI
jgi:L-threonylcarbamoyladenylate synthase